MCSKQHGWLIWPVCQAEILASTNEQDKCIITANTTPLGLSSLVLHPGNPNVSSDIWMDIIKKGTIPPISTMYPEFDSELSTYYVEVSPGEASLALTATANDPGKECLGYG